MFSWPRGFFALRKSLDSHFVTYSIIDRNDGSCWNQNFPCIFCRNWKFYGVLPWMVMVWRGLILDSHWSKYSGLGLWLADSRPVLFHINKARVTYSQISWFPIFRNLKLTRDHFTMTSRDPESPRVSQCVCALFSVFIINHWSADCVSCQDVGLGTGCRPPSAEQPLHNAQIWTKHLMIASIVLSFWCVVYV